MTTSERLAVAYEEAVHALAHRAQLAGVAEPEGFARAFMAALHGRGWRAYAPVTALPKPPVEAAPIPEGFKEGVLRDIASRRPSPTTPEEAS